jgi:hypothetical protein
MTSDVASATETVAKKFNALPNLQLVNAIPKANASSLSLKCNEMILFCITAHLHTWNRYYPVFDGNYNIPNIL